MSSPPTSRADVITAALFAAEFNQAHQGPPAAAALTPTRNFFSSIQVSFMLADSPGRAQSLRPSGSRPRAAIRALDEVARAADAVMYPTLACDGRGERVVNKEIFP
ncbi:hypothetical protein M3I53_34405 [Paraburkholderia sp. CNPSo 3272]|uniref:hypothetical protein n=1 Tax=Paraburkholderia sp. CNPSo 3272 TaxID=2940931 RepID=UPI0020B67940|nr:hypothetical protein [Paraburkholderia sp. CNPSo 3272]MCP3728144.1 hypothetical protein [Paraburkholderia sp. CNPSo 3272]